MLTIIKLLLNKQTTLIYLILLSISFLIHFQHDYNKRILVLKELNIVTSSSEEDLVLELMSDCSEDD